jgi:hypothetical protein
MHQIAKMKNPSRHRKRAYFTGVWTGLPILPVLPCIKGLRKGLLLEAPGGELFNESLTFLEPVPDLFYAKRNKEIYNLNKSEWEPILTSLIVFGASICIHIINKSGLI